MRKAERRLNRLIIKQVIVVRSDGLIWEGLIGSWGRKAGLKQLRRKNKRQLTQREGES